MHIAICDNNIADRKQTERLMNRECHKRQTTEHMLYIDSYGSHETLQASPMLYDAFFIDYATTDETGLDVAKTLRSIGVTAPIVLCSYMANDRLNTNDLSNIYYLHKPIKVEALSNMIDHCIALKNSIQVPIEIRGEFDTYYIREKELLYLKEEKNNFTIHLLDGTVISVFGSMDNAYHSLENNELFYLTSKSCLVNLRYIKTIDKTSFTFVTGETLPIFLFNVKQLKYWHELVSKTL